MGLWKKRKEKKSSKATSFFDFKSLISEYKDLDVQKSAEKYHDLVDKPHENDKEIEDHGIELYVDRKSYIFLAGTSLEYQGCLLYTSPSPRD